MSPARKPVSTVSPARSLAAQVLGRVLDEDAFVALALDAALTRQRSMLPADKALTTELVYGTLRHLPLVDLALKQASARELKKIDPLLLQPLRVAAYQLVYAGHADHASVHEAVEIIKQLRGEGAGKFANGVLRGLCRLRDAGALMPSSRPGAEGVSAQTGLPRWLADELVERLGTQGALEFGQDALRRPPLHVSQVGTPEQQEQALALLKARGMEAAAHPWVSSTLVIAAGAGAPESWIAELPGTAWVQNAASQLVSQWAAQIALRMPEAFLVDLCAAPGGKSLGLQRAGVRVLAADVHVDKLHLAQRQWTRAGVTPQVVCMDAGLPALRPGCAPTVLLDAPCSGTGVLARRPEIKLRRGVDDVKRLSQLQQRLLDAAATLVPVGGSILYSVCSVTHAEGPMQAQEFLQRHQSWKQEACCVPGIPDSALKEGALFLWPHLHGTDGFYAVHLRRHGDSAPVP